MTSRIVSFLALFFSLVALSGQRAPEAQRLGAQEPPKIPVVEETKAPEVAPMPKAAIIGKDGKPLPEGWKDNRDRKLFPTGAKPTPKHKLFAAPRFHDLHKVEGPIPTQFALVPSKLSNWLNDQYGDCVTAEEAGNQACRGVFIQDATVMAFASKNGLLNGADLAQVLDLMKASGFKQDGNTYSVGDKATVDYTNELTLRTALSQGPVKLGMDANALPSGAGNVMGWTASGGSPGEYGNEDHCTGLWGYGPVSFCFQQLGVAIPSTLPNGWTKDTIVYLFYTWKTIGVVDHAWIMSTVGEAWSRTPNTVIVGTGTPTPDPPLNPPPPASLTVTLPNLTSQVGQLAPFGIQITGGTAPYTAQWTYGDGQTGLAPNHVYATAGTFNVSVTVSDSSKYPLSGTATATATITAVPPPPTPNVLGDNEYAVDPIGKSIRAGKNWTVSGGATNPNFLDVSGIDAGTMDTLRKFIEFVRQKKAPAIQMRKIP